jgi:pimeloyl-ACP methyl ester carboxylesterase
VVVGVLAAVLVGGVVYQAIGEALDRQKFPPLGRLIEAVGRHWHIVDSGSGATAVVFESGLAASCLNWTRVREEVALFARACAYDRVSLGWSDSARPPRVASTLVAELHAVLAAAQIAPPYILVGHSFGGMLMGMFAANHPEEVAGLVLIDPLPASEWLKPSEAQTHMLERGVRLARRGAWLARFGIVRFALKLFTGGARRIPQAVARITSSGSGESLISRLVGEVGKMPREVWPMVTAHWCLPKSFEGLAAALEALPQSSAEAANLLLPASIPLTILSAANSTPVQRAEREALAKRSARGRHLVVAKSGHWIHLDDPALVVDAIRDLMT